MICWFFSLSLILLTPMLRAQTLCSTVVSAEPAKNWNNEFNTKFRKALIDAQDLTHPELYFYWHMAYPFQLKKIDDFNYSVEISNKRMRIFHNNDDANSESPLMAINTFLARQDTSNKEMLMGFLKSYKDRVSPQVIEAILDLESLIESTAKSRQSFGYVGTKSSSEGGEMIGTFRIFNGVPAHSNSSPQLPFEHSLHVDGVQSVTVNRLEKLRSQNSHALLFEIGKLSLQGSEGLSNRARTMLELFLLKKYVDSLPDEALFFVHTLTPGHVRLYERRYGFRVIETLQIPNQKEKEFIMEATGKELRESLRKIYDFAPRGFQLLYSEK